MAKRKNYGVYLFGNETEPASKSDDLLKETHEAMETAHCEPAETKS